MYLNLKSFCWIHFAINLLITSPSEHNKFLIFTHTHTKMCLTKNQQYILCEFYGLHLFIYYYYASDNVIALLLFPSTHMCKKKSCSLKRNKIVFNQFIRPFLFSARVCPKECECVVAHIELRSMAGIIH